MRNEKALASHAVERRLLAVGGIHVMEEPCMLLQVEPPDALTNLAWPGRLALEARRQGEAIVDCGGRRSILQIAHPVRAEITLDATETRPSVFRLQLRLFDDEAHELEVGQFTHVDWTASDILTTANDRSAGEFGWCDTCYGRQTFRAVKSGSGAVVARFGGIECRLSLDTVTS